MASKHQADTYESHGKTLNCLFCGHDQFFQREGKIQTTGLTFFDLDWLNKSANCMVCQRCGYVHWFLPAD